MHLSPSAFYFTSAFVCLLQNAGVPYNKKGDKIHFNGYNYT